MQKIGAALVFSPTDLTHFLECEYLSRLELDVAGGRVLTFRRQAEADVLARRGESHERAQLENFRTEGKRIAVIPDPDADGGWAEGASRTRDAMAAGADVVYQAVFEDDTWRGRADFLIRVPGRSAFGDWAYEAWDTKLARTAKPTHVLQLAFYSERTGEIQRALPEWMGLILGTGEAIRFRTRDFLPYYRAVRRSFLRGVLQSAHVSPYPVAHCAFCGYNEHCEDWWSSRDHLSLVAGIRRSQAERLQEHGVPTTAALAAVGDITIGISEPALTTLRRQAALQTAFRLGGRHRYELLPPTDENGFRFLPQPSPGDIFFDIEGFPYFETSRGLEYLFGVVTADREPPEFSAFRASDRTAEKLAFEGFLDFVWERLRRWPDLHIYHYAQYEPTALKRLMGEHASREDQLDELLRREVFVDLYRVVRRAIRISHDSYSLKAVRQFFMPDAGKGAVSGGAESIVEFQRWLDKGDPAILQAIEDYNREDCVSTLRLRDWLLERKTEAERTFGITIPFLSLSERREREVELEPDERRALRDRLSALAQPWAVLLGDLLDYHRREAKPEWWAYFDRRRKSLDDLLDDTEAISFLEDSGEAPTSIDRSIVHALCFPPQEFKLAADAKVEGPLDYGFAGTIEWVDAAAGRLGLRRSRARSRAPLPAAIIAGKPVRDEAQRSAIVRVAEAIASGDVGYRALRDILRCSPPRFVSGRIGSIQTLDLSEQARLIADLDQSYLFFQGPPGSGKTWTGARLIVSLIAAGKRVGVTATSHKAIHNLLHEVERVAADRDLGFVGIKKRSEADETAFPGTRIRNVRENDECKDSGVDLIAGTAWLFSREGMDQALDYLFIDEAGQMGLADAIAVGTCARNIVLLGDPQQLPHVTQSSHPNGSGRSVLRHLLGEAATIAEDRGIFLASTWRMHPDICRFVSAHSYDGRLESAPGCELQRVFSPGLSGAGLRYVPVEHRNNAQQSPEEAQVVASEARALLRGGTRVDRHGRTCPLTPADILVVAPYNMQVRCLREALPDGVDVGTVDKFQGREAAVVFFSMASSSGDDVPRGLEFLFNRNRFNVAISRAKCLSVVVGSPRLLEARCDRIEQMPLVNALCAFAEMAEAQVAEP